MLKRLYLASGTLISPLACASDDMVVDSTLASYISNQLLYGEWTYLSINWMDNTEIVKLYVDNSGLNLVRGIEGNRFSFPAGSTVTYVLTQSEIQDAVISVPVNIYANGYGAATVNNTGEIYTIGYTPLNVETLGGISAFYTTDGELEINDAVGAFGCTSIAESGAPLIPGPYFYLTSQLYPYIAIDKGIVPNAPDKNGKAPPFMGPVTLTTLLEFYSTHESLLQNIYVDAMQLYAAGVSYVAKDGPLKQSITVESMLLYSINIQYTSKSDNLKTNCYPLSALVYGGVVATTMNVDNLKMTITAHDVTVH